MPPRLLFADTFYWVALLNPGDASHAPVTMVAKRALCVSEVLANNHHFTQEGFTIVFPGP